jgi:hypothetical protein
MALSAAIDWDKDGTWNDTGEDVTSRVMASPGVTLEYGRDQSTALAPMVAGRGSFTLNNASGDYTPLNSGSPIFGNIKPARPVLLERSVGANDYVLFAGHTDDTPLNPDLSNRTVQISLVDYLADFRGQTISTALYTGKFTGEIIDIILDEVGWDAGLRDLDTGASVLPYWWEDGTDAFTALDRVLQAEGPPALLTIGADGSIVFRSRHHRLLDTASISSQDTWYGATTEPYMSRLLYDDGWRNIINTGTISVETRTVRAIEPVWTMDEAIHIGASATKTFIATANDPFTAAITPVSGTDYVVEVGSLSSVTLSRTSGASTTITLTAGGSGAQLTNLQLRAQPVSVAYTTQVTASDATSITDYGQRAFPTDPPFINTFDAQGILESVIEQRAQPLSIVQCEFYVPPSNTARADAILGRDLSDRVTIDVDAAFLNNDFYIESFSHSFGTELDHAVTVGCELVPTTDVDASNVFILGSSVDGHRLGSGKLAP